MTYPAFANKVVDIDEYDAILLGFLFVLDTRK